MSKRYHCDKLRRRLSPDELSTLKVAGPLKYMTGSPELHLSKPAAAALAKWLGYDVEMPELEPVEGPTG